VFKPRFTSGFVKEKRFTYRQLWVYLVSKAKLKQMEKIVLSCLESRIEENQSVYSRFLLGPFISGHAVTVATALRRALLSEVKNSAITALHIQGITHEFSTLVGVRESVLELSLNFQQIIIYNQTRTRSVCQVGYLHVQGPAIVYANDLKLPNGIECVNPTQYIATLSTEGLLVVKFLIGEKKSCLKSNTSTLNSKKIKEAKRYSNSLTKASRPEPRTKPRRRPASILLSVVMARFTSEARVVQLFRAKQSLVLQSKSKASNLESSSAQLLEEASSSAPPLKLKEEGTSSAPPLKLKLKLKVEEGTSSTLSPSLKALKALKALKDLKALKEEVPLKPKVKVETTRLADQSRTTVGTHSNSLSLLDLDQSGEPTNSEVCLRTIIPLDPIFTPVYQVNFGVERDDLSNQVRERVIMEVWTNGSIHPRQAIHEAALSTMSIFSKLRKTFQLDSHSVFLEPAANSRFANSNSKRSFLGQSRDNQSEPLTKANRAITTDNKIEAFTKPSKRPEVAKNKTFGFVRAPLGQSQNQSFALVVALTKSKILFVREALPPRVSLKAKLGFASQNLGQLLYSHNQIEPRHNHRQQNRSRPPARFCSWFRPALVSGLVMAIQNRNKGFTYPPPQLVSSARSETFSQPSSKERLSILYSRNLDERSFLSSDLANFSLSLKTYTFLKKKGKKSISSLLEYSQHALFRFLNSDRTMFDEIEKCLLFLGLSLKRIFLSSGLANLPLSLETSTFLKKRGKETIGSILEYSPDGLVWFLNGDEKMLDEIERGFLYFGFPLKRSFLPLDLANLPPPLKRCTFLNKKNIGIATLSDYFPSRLFCFLSDSYKEKMFNSIERSFLLSDFTFKLETVNDLSSFELGNPALSLKTSTFLKKRGKETIGSILKYSPDDLFWFLNGDEEMLAEIKKCLLFLGLPFRRSFLSNRLFEFSNPALSLKTLSFLIKRGKKNIGSILEYSPDDLFSFLNGDRTMYYEIKLFFSYTLSRSKESDNPSDLRRQAIDGMNRLINGETGACEVWEAIKVKKELDKPEEQKEREAFVLRAQKGHAAKKARAVRPTKAYEVRKAKARRELKE